MASSIDSRTKIVAVGAASNLLGTVNDFVRVVARARAVGAVSFVDAVHLAPHGLIDVEAIACDMLVCSPYKFFGPHVGTLFVRRPWALRLTPYKLRPSSDELPGYINCQGNRWELGTQNYEGIVGAAAAVAYIASLSSRFSSSSVADSASRPQSVAVGGCEGAEGEGNRETAGMGRGGGGGAFPG